MPKVCEQCGCPMEDTAKFCPGCGEAAPPLTEPEKPPKQNKKHGEVTVQPEPIIEENGEEKRVFIPREKKYGDTEHFDDPGDYKEREIEKNTMAAKSNVSLYLSIFAAVLSVTAVALVIIFSVLPANRREQSEATPPTVQATAAPTQLPTEPPIAGTYSLLTIDADSPGLTAMLLKNSTIRMNGDDTGKLILGGTEIGDVVLDRDTATARVFNKDCGYTFDGKLLIITYSGMTLVYQKEL